MRVPNRQIRAVYDEDTVRVYQAYRHEIADAALAAQTLVPPFGMNRMTWIKPSFTWMLYRSGYGKKDPGQARILALDITRQGFEWALGHAGLSHGPNVDNSTCVRVQWDPERNLDLGRLEHRSIQIGLRGEAVERYVGEWIQRVTDLTELAARIDAERDPALLPVERPYPLSEALQARLEMTPRD